MGVFGTKLLLCAKNPEATRVSANETTNKTNVIPRMIYSAARHAL